MGATKRMIEKSQSLESCARNFLLENDFIEEALNGHLCTKTYSDRSDVYIKANTYYKEHKLNDLFTLTEFRDEIKNILDTSEFIDSFEYDLERIK